MQHYILLWCHQIHTSGKIILEGMKPNHLCIIQQQRIWYFNKQQLNRITHKWKHLNDIKTILWIWKSFGWFIAISQIHYVSIAPKMDWYVHRTTPTHKLKELHIPNIILRIWKTIYSLFDVSACVFDAQDCILVIIKMICKFIFYLVMNFRQQYFC